jgi:amino acid adenylation domain-containing protein
VSDKPTTDRQALIQQRLLAATRKADANRIPHTPGRVVAPLSAAQKRIWLLHEFDPASPVWNRPLALRLRGPLIVDALLATLRDIVRRHQVLRTHYKVDDGQPKQFVQPLTELPFRTLDLSHLPPSQAEFQAQRIVQGECARTVDISQDPMLSVLLLQLAPQENVLLLLMHHVSFDGWSENVFLKEFVQIYRALSGGLDSPLAEPSIQYADFAEWEDGARKRGDLDRSLAYWTQQFSTLPQRINLPELGQDDRGSRYDGKCESLTLPIQLSQRLRTFSQSEKASLFMTLLMAYQVLLARYGDQQDITVGVPVAGRHRRETEELIGCFMNVLLFRADVAHRLTVRELLAQTRETALGAFAHQTLPFDRLCEALKPERQVGRWPLFQAMFHLRNLPQLSAESPGRLKIDLFEIEQTTIGGLDLSLEVQDKTDGLVCSLTYRRGLFEPDQAKHMLIHFQNLLEAMVTNPDKPVWALPMLTPTEVQQQLVTWNDTAADFPSLCVHELVEQQVERTPDAVAVVCGSEELTYSELNNRANQLALSLRELGVASDRLVGLCLDRTPEMMIAVLAVAKAGGAYVPLDPDHPFERLRGLVGNAGLDIILVNRAAPRALLDLVENVVDLDRDFRTSQRGGEQNLETIGTPADLLYVLHTSGSTGPPKGVMVRHASLVNLLSWRRNTMPLFPQDRLLHRAAYTFDDSVWETFEPLTVGAGIVLAEPGRESDCSYMVETVVQHRVTAICLVPSQLDLFLKEPGIENCRTLRRVNTGGEVVSQTLVDRFHSLFHMPLVSGYGPTEVTVACSYCLCEPGQRISIGRPISNVQLYILGPHLQPLPVGARGELCVAGAGLAAGYLNDTETTRKKFIPNPFTTVRGSRLYRTGDKARYRKDSHLEFLGRVDGQVKVRGNRIELAEIETALSDHPAVGLVAVVVRELSPPSKDLVAFLVTKTELEIAELREFLGRRLPGPMIPSRWVFLEEMPMTASGKIVRNSLLNPGDQRSDAVGEFRPPRGAKETVLADLWSKLLGLERVGTRDNFFDLGGHSLLAVTMFHAVQREFGVKLPLSSLYEAPTVELMARLLQTRPTEWAPSVLVPIKPDGKRPPLFALHAGKGGALTYGPFAQHLDPDQPMFALQSVGFDSQETPLDRVEDMAQCYLREIQRVQPSGPYHVIGFCFGSLVAWEIAHQLQSQGEEVGFFAMVSHDGLLKPPQGFAPGALGHFQALAGLQPSRWGSYLAGRARYRFRRVWTSLCSHLYRILNGMGVPTPARFRDQRITDLNFQAGQRYDLQPGPWRVYFFEGWDDLIKGGPDFWVTLARGGVHVQSVAGRGPSIWREPNVGDLAAKVSRALNVQSSPQAQSRAR